MDNLLLEFIKAAPFMPHEVQTTVIKLIDCSYQEMTNSPAVAQFEPDREEPYKHTNSAGVQYWLCSQDVVLRNGIKQTIYYFAKERRPEACPMPKGYKVHENPRNGFLTVAHD
jgi:hypothetical protein